MELVRTFVGEDGDTNTPEREILIPPFGLAGRLSCPLGTHSVVVFAQGGGSSRRAPRNLQVADALNHLGISTLLVDLLLPEEDHDRCKVFDVHLLAERLIDSVRWLGANPNVSRLPVGLLGASTGAAAALIAASELGTGIGAIVSRGGRPDLASTVLPHINAPTLLIVGGDDTGVIELNRWAFDHLGGEKALEVVPHATHLFSEPGAIETATDLAAHWFEHHLVPSHSAASARSIGTR